MHSLNSYKYELPPELIASTPLPQRDSSRLLLVDRKAQTIQEGHFSDLSSLLSPRDTLIFNNTKVIKARLYAKRASGGKVELLLVKRKGSQWEIMAKPARKLHPGDFIYIGERITCRIDQDLPSGNKLVTFLTGDFDAMLEQYGEIPIPHYMGREARALDEIRYQTVYAKEPGSVAAPTAGLHFTPELLEKIPAKKGYLTLHVGPGTFKPVQVDDIRHHHMHSEEYYIPSGLLEGAGRKIAVGTTSLRALESSQGKEGWGETSLFIYPGYQFQVVEGLITNFHLPCSSLLMLVTAFGGYDFVMEAYRRAVEKRFRFYSYGDAMYIF